jgi:hypothetical protein
MVNLEAGTVSGFKWLLTDCSSRRFSSFSLLLDKLVQEFMLWGNIWSACEQHEIKYTK